ncbi:MAG TPA: thioredoxin family protein [Salinarimonas sp.]|nr:thioredoxin family protein [Salinarimonas sp.]
MSLTISRLYPWLAACLLTLAVAPIHAQYKIHTWESFENGLLPPRFTTGHHADQTTVVPFPYSRPGTPPEVTAHPAPQIAGTYGLAFLTKPDKLHLSLVSPISLDRSLLGATGRALYQADFYLPPEGQPLPNTALLAVQSDGQKQPKNYKMYRFGIGEGGNRLYFAYANDSVSGSGAAPILYYALPLKDFGLKRPGWYRFQMIFDGQGTITCAVDMKKVKFPVIKETTLNPLNAGIMVASSEGGSNSLVDNLSIQWANEDVPLPDSPWLRTQTQLKEGQNLMDGTPGLAWQQDPKQAWKMGSSMKKPLLVKFHAPKAMPYQYLKSITPATPQARDLLGRYVLLDVDVNQLEGGTLAQRYQIVRVPTFVVIDPNGTEKARLPIIRNGTTWDQVAAFLEKASAGNPGSATGTGGAGAGQ